MTLHFLSVNPLDTALIPDGVESVLQKPTAIDIHEASLLARRAQGDKILASTTVLKQVNTVQFAQGKYT